MVDGRFGSAADGADGEDGPFRFRGSRRIAGETLSKTGVRLGVLDFVRVPGKSPEWMLNHVWVGQTVGVKESAAAG